MNESRTEEGPALPDSLAGFGVLYFGNSWNTENRTSSHHVAFQLARRMPVLYMDSPGLRVPSVTGRDMRKMFRTASLAFARPARIRENLWHGQVAQLPYRRMPGVAGFNRAFGTWAANRAKSSLPCKRWISWFVVPHLGFLAGRLGEAMCVYYCVDDYAAHPMVDQEIVTALDRELTRKAHQVFVAPPAIVEAKRLLNPSTVYSPHGVDAELFGRARDARTTIPERAARLRHPVIGFFGLLADWIDVALIAALAKARPAWSFLLVGHVGTNVDPFAGVGNIALVGAQPYESLPSWAKAFDVAIIPYRDVRQTRHANPLKLREYLATGRPVVATPNAEVERFREWVRIARTAPEFLDQIERAIREDSPSAAAARMAAVRPMTWSARVQSVLEVVGKRMTEQATT